jgi:hypothetical protein
MKQIAILASLTLALVLLAINVAAAEDCYATNCAINAPAQNQNSGTRAPQAPASALAQRAPQIVARDFERNGQDGLHEQDRRAVLSLVHQVHDGGVSRLNTAPGEVASV